MNNNRRIVEPIIPETFYCINKFEQYMPKGHTRSFTKGSIILSQGTESDNLLYVHSGCIALSIGTDDGHNKFLFHVREHSIGMTTFLPDNHELQISAVQNSTVCFFTIKQLLEIFREDEQLILDIMQNILTKTYYFMVQARELNFSRPSSRVFRLLYNLCLAEGERRGNCFYINSKLTQKAIGEITGTHYVTVCKLFSLLDKQEILKKTKDKIIIYDLEKLKALIHTIIDY